MTLPTEPTRRDKARLPVIALVVPLAAGVALVAFTGNPSYLAFVLLSPLMVLGTFLNDRFGGRRSARAEQAAYDEALAGAREAVATAVTAEEAARHLAHPGASTLLQAATGRRHGSGSADATTTTSCRCGSASPTCRQPSTCRRRATKPPSAPWPGRCR